MYFLFIMFALFAFVLFGNIIGLVRTYSSHK